MGNGMAYTFCGGLIQVTELWNPIKLIEFVGTIVYTDTMSFFDSPGARAIMNGNHPAPGNLEVKVGFSFIAFAVIIVECF